jgi:hypothetical protein
MVDLEVRPYSERRSHTSCLSVSSCDWRLTSFRHTTSRSKVPGSQTATEDIDRFLCSGCRSQTTLSQLACPMTQIPSVRALSGALRIPAFPGAKRQQKSCECWVPAFLFLSSAAMTNITLILRSNFKTHIKPELEFLIRRGKQRLFPDSTQWLCNTHLSC